MGPTPSHVHLRGVHLVPPSGVGHDLPYQGLQRGLIALVVHRVTLCLHEIWLAASTMVY